MSKKGIDVSSNNGIVNWEQVKNNGYEFAIIRLGYGNDEVRQDDSQFLTNIKECERLGIPYGVYIYSYALNLNNAKSEVSHTLRLLKNVGNNFKYGVWFDMEDADNYKKKNGMPSNEMLVNICYTFCEAIENAGYYTGIYASLSWLNNQLNNSKLDRFDKWVAHWYVDKTSYKKVHSIHQFTDKANINGKIFDANYLIRDFAITQTTKKEKSLDELAQEVINGIWGNGADRKNRLTQDGYDYNAVQSIVNQKLGVAKTMEYYTIQRGDNLTKIANRYGVTVAQLINWNNIKNANLIYAGQKIRVK